MEFPSKQTISWHQCTEQQATGRWRGTEVNREICHRPRKESSKMVIYVVPSPKFLFIICCGIKYVHFCQWILLNYAFSTFLWYYPRHESSISGPRTICYHSSLGSLFTHALSNKLAIVSKDLKTASSSFEMLCSLWVQIPVISIKYNIQLIPKAPVSTSYLQTLLNQAAIWLEGSSCSFSVWFYTGFHSNCFSFSGVFVNWD